MNPPQDVLAWYHIILTTYGAWLYGDARGFRTRHHRQHVDGDYRNPPPPGRYDTLEQRSRAALKQPPVTLPPTLREVLGRALVERLDALGAHVACIAVGGQHVHLLVQMPKRQTRHWMGVAKRHAWFALRERGWTTRLWAKRGKAVVVKDRGHHLNTYRYILNHAHNDAWVWSSSDKT